MLKKNYSIDEGIEKLRSLTISERIKTNNNNEKLSEIQNRIINQKLIQNCNINSNKINQYKRKRNYISLINNQNNNNNKSTNTINNSIRVNENINEEQKDINKLLFVDDIAPELLKSKDEEELKKILFNQLVLLDQKKRKDKNMEQIAQILYNLENDNKDLLKCQKVVSRALNRKIYSKSTMDMKLKELENEIMTTNGRIEYYQIVGDYYKSELNK
jgi:hypothetical protein